MKIVGKRMVDYVSKKTKSPVKGIALQCTFSQNDVEGLAVQEIFVNALSDMYKQVAAAPLGSEINVYYNRWGSPETITIVK